MNILAFESSCDETAVAVVRDGRDVLSGVLVSQTDLHALYGGVVPEIASRSHMEVMTPLTRQALREADLSLSAVDAVAVTYAPGLVGALLVGVNFAKTLAWSLRRPLIPVHHIRGHIAACALADPSLAPPFVALVLSGGHTLLVHVRGRTEFDELASTRDDAVGEALDKVGRVLGLPYPGGVAMDALALAGDPARYPFPKVKVEDRPLDFSLSGLKTAALSLVNRAAQKKESLCPQDLAASFFHAIWEQMEPRLVQALSQTQCRSLAVCGGVAASRFFSGRLAAFAEQKDVSLCIPPPALCGDNAQMIGAQAYYEFLAGNVADWSLNAVAQKSLL